MSDQGLPQLSVLLVTPDNFETVRKTVRHMRAQTVRDRMELLIVAPSRAELGLIESEIEGFQRVQVVEVGEVKRTTEAKLAGIRRANAPVIAFAEDHCYPDPDWAEALINAHREPWAAVGPLMHNANPRTMLSWAGLILHFGCCTESVTSGTSEHLPWHNIAYKRDLLLEYGDDLPSMLIVEGVLLDDLRAKGHKLYFEAAAKTSHVNISRFSSWVRHAFWGGRLYGGIRAQKQKRPPWRRLLYVCGAPLIPLIRFRRTIRRIRQLGLQQKLIPRIFPALITGLVPHAIGEVMGYAFGLGKAERHYMRFELSRIQHVTSQDRKVMID